jgi:ribonuclease III
MNIDDHAEIEQKLCYQFRSTSLLEEALRHSSFVNEQPDLDLRDNERLEFLGDAVLNLIIGHILMQHYPDLKEGDLSRMRANLVNETQLARIARSIDLGPFIRLGKGEIQTNGRQKNSILADTFEALIAAIYLDGGFDAAFNIIETQFAPLLKGKHSSAHHHDYKSKLQEIVQVEQGAMPKYSVTRENGPDHEKTFWITLNVFDIETQGLGKSKKMAEQDAARKALELLKERS